MLTREIALMKMKVTRGEQIINKLVLNDTLSPSGRDFLLAALDPMHDNQFKELNGWPDVETAPSVVRCIKQSVTVTSSGNTNWDFHLIQWPWMCMQVFQTTALRTGNFLQIPSTPGYALGGLQGWIVQSGTPLNIAIQSNVWIELADIYMQGTSRLIGVGIEVVNTTAEINKQGQVFSWRQPAPYVQPTGYNIFGSATGQSRRDFPITGQVVPCPPLVPADAMLLPGTRQWAAKDGTYIVVPHIGQDNPPTPVDYIQPIIALSQVSDSTQGVAATATSPPASANTNPLAVPVPYVVTSVSANMPPFKIYPIHLTGALFSGLSPSSSLTITWNVYIETFPDLASKDILVLATPSAEYDPIALQLYSHALTTLPIAVPSNWNGFGDWFADVVATITDFLTPGAAALGMPGIAAISHGAGTLAKQYLAAPSPQQKVKVLKAPPLNKKKNMNTNNKGKNKKRKPNKTGPKTTQQPKP